MAECDSTPSAAAGGLYEGFMAYRTDSADEMREVLRTALVVFDTNVLLNLYRYGKEARASIIDVMSALADRLWIPHQVLEEFWRNRERALAEPLSQVKATATELSKLQNEVVDQLRMWVNRAALTAEASGRVESQLAEAFEQAQTLLDGLMDEGTIQRARNTQNDPVLALLEPVLDGRVGPPMDAATFAAAIKEGDRRVGAGEPPGFEDSKKRDRPGEGAAGDYLVWEQTLIEAAARGVRAVTIVTGDVKRDWWRHEGNNPRGPRIELAREMEQRCGARLYLLRPESLLEFADALAVSVRPGSVEDVERTARLDSSDRPDESGGGWSRLALDTLMRSLTKQAPVQEATIRFAAENGGYISREDVYNIGEYDESRQLKGFTRPVNRLVQDLRDAGAIPETAPDVLAPVYDEGTHGFGWADGFRIPEDVIGLLRERVGHKPNLNPSVGDRVDHQAFGAGRVVALKGSGDRAQCQVDFGGDVGVKWLMLNFAPLRVAEE